jgi:hypothetical protein
LGQSKKTFESKNMKDIQLENWEKELNSLLTINEGITVSTSTGQQGSPDSVSVNATDGDSAELLQVLRQAGLGVFGGEEERSSYGSPMNSQEPTGAGSEPEMSPAVVGDGDDMMALIKKMSGIKDSGEPEGVAVVDVSSEEDDDEASHYGSDNHNHEDEDEVDEGNDFTEKLKNTPPGGKFSIGGKQYTDTSSLEEEDRLISKANPDDGSVSTSSSTGRIQATLGPNGVSVSPKSNGQNIQNGSDTYRKAQKQDEGHDHEEGGTCNECGMFEARCVCEPGEEQVEEDQLDEKVEVYRQDAPTPGQTGTSTPYRSSDKEFRDKLAGEVRTSRNQGTFKPTGGDTYNRMTAGGTNGSKLQAMGMKNSGQKQVEEDYANEAGHEEMAQLKHLLSMGNDMHKEKRSQAVGNPQQVTFETKLLKDSTSLLQDFQKLSGIK